MTCLDTLGSLLSLCANIAMYEPAFCGRILAHGTHARIATRRKKAILASRKNLTEYALKLFAC